ncbi:MAG: 3-isopropylmalate dehydratase small subunit, partial [Deltaproteobacteria bacterium]|nr:3-isopropylmalate dehydratase small subunit [Deltaproteobacteria bacterium]
VDTDMIIPARFLNVSDKDKLAGNCFADSRPDFVKEVRPGDTIVAGTNFGCGSSREHAPLAIKAAGISVIIAKSFSRNSAWEGHNTLKMVSCCLARFWKN